MANRIEDMIELVQVELADLVTSGEKTPEALAQLSKKLDMDFQEHAKYQEVKSIAVSEGTLNSEEAQSIYRYLSHSVDKFNSQTLAVKIALTKLFAILMQKRLQKQGVL